jgi:hypothetical protein
MKVQIKNLKPNPYRDMKKLPINPIKVEALKNSITETEFWDNILARPKSGHAKEPIFEIAYGHHRLAALKELKIEEIDIPIKDLDDATMIQIMANENMEDWETTTAGTNETVRIARDFLTGELRKYKMWKDLRGITKILFNTERSFIQTKTHGVGEPTITKFLGNNWSENTVRIALENIKETEIEQEALETFERPSQAQEFRKAVKEINKEKPNTIPKEKTIELAKKIKVKQNEKPKSKQHSIKTMVRQEVEHIDEFEANIKELELELSKITSDSKNLTGRIVSVNTKLDALNIEDIKSLSSLFQIDAFLNLFTAVAILTKYYGIEFNKQIMEELQ